MTCIYVIDCLNIEVIVEEPVMESLCMYEKSMMLIRLTMLIVLSKHKK